MARQDFDELFIEEIPEHTLGGGEFPDGYGNTMHDIEETIPAATVIRAVSPITVPELRQKIARSIPYLDRLLELEESGHNPSGLVLGPDEDHLGRGIDPPGLFSAALKQAVAVLVRRSGKDDTDPWGGRSADGVGYSVYVGDTPDGQVTQITVCADKAVARELVESGRLFTTLPCLENGEWWDDGIAEAFNESIGELVVAASVAPFLRSTSDDDSYGSAI